jgi:hypothetical protein
LSGRHPATAGNGALDAIGAWIDEGLQAFAASARRESSIGPFGRIALRWDLKRLAANAMQVERALHDHPQWAAAPVAQPLFIFGLPRSGTTFLHHLLAEDPDNHIPRCWQTMHPAPRPRDFRPAEDRRCRSMARQLRVFAWLSPEMRALHPIDADSPQECTEIMSLCGRSLRFDTTHRAPSYLQWLEAGGYDGAYGFHKRFLQFLQAGAGDGHWVLKSPDHLFAFDALCRTYPDARFVVTHRDPAQVLPSVARLTEVVRRPFVRDIDPLDVGRQVGDRWRDGLQRMLVLDREGRLSPDRTFHLRYRDFVRDPLTAIEAIYRHCGRRLSAAARTRMQAMIAGRPRGGYGDNHYTAERYGYHDLRTDAVFAEYRQHFGLDTAGSPRGRVALLNPPEAAMTPAARGSRNARRAEAGTAAPRAAEGGR